MSSNDPFDQQSLNAIFKVSSSRPDCLNSRENSTLEFKKTFGWGGSASKYSRTIGAIANAKGGYIVFGIENNPHRMVGLSSKHLSAFECTDPTIVTDFLNRHYSPEIHWAISEHEVSGNKFGLIYVYPSNNKPVVCTKDAGNDLREGDIYYRYRGRTTRIRHPELQGIFDERKKAEQKLWLKHLSKIARVGVRDAGVFDLHTGQVSGSAGSFIIDESLLSQLSFIKEGDFSKSSGRPTLKLIGNVESSTDVVSAAKQIVKTKGIRTADIVLGFLRKEKTPEPRDYIAQVCFETTAFLPIYYFINVAKMDTQEALSLLEGTISRSQTRSRIIKRLSSRDTQEMKLPSTQSQSAKKKRGYAEMWLSKGISESLSGIELKYALHALRSIQPDDVRRRSKYIREILSLWFNKYYTSAKGDLVDSLRRAICWIDEALYKS